MMYHLLVALGAVHVLWGMFVICMALKRVQDAGQLTLAMKLFGYPFLLLGLVVDVAVNVVIGSLLFLEPPREWLLSARLWRLSNGRPSWRQRIALKIRTQLLDSIDPSGIHRG